jgi:hypothetical protein
MCFKSGNTDSVCDTCAHIFCGQKRDTIAAKDSQRNLLSSIFKTRFSSWIIFINVALRASWCVLRRSRFSFWSTVNSGCSSAVFIACRWKKSAGRDGNVIVISLHSGEFLGFDEKSLGKLNVFLASVQEKGAIPYGSDSACISMWISAVHNGVREAGPGAATELSNLARIV